MDKQMENSIGQKVLFFNLDVNKLLYPTQDLNVCLSQGSRHHEFQMINLGAEIKLILIYSIANCVIAILPLWKMPESTNASASAYALRNKRYES